MTVENSERTPATRARTGLSGTQVVTSALASVSAAVIASFFGVAGTLIGAALASVITTVSAAFYGASLRRTTERLHGLRTRSGPAARTGLPARLSPRRPPAPGRPRVTGVALAAAAVFGLAMVLITTVELIGQRPVSAMVGAASQRSTTTVGELTGGGATSTGTPSPSPASPSPQTTALTPPSATATHQSPAPASSAPASTASSSGHTAAPRSSDPGAAGASAPAAATTAP